MPQRTKFGSLPIGHTRTPDQIQVAAYRAYPLSKSIPKPLQIQPINKAELHKIKFLSSTHTDKGKSEVCTGTSRHGCKRINQSLLTLQDELRPSGPTLRQKWVDQIKSRRRQEAIQVFYLGLGAPGQIVPKLSQPVLVGGICCTAKFFLKINL